MRKTVVTLLALSVAAWLAPAARAADPATLATVGDRKITRAEVEDKVRPKMVEIENERYEALKEGLDEVIADELVKREAKARSVTPEALLKTEVEDKIPAPTDEAVQKVYDDNKKQLGSQTLDQVKPRVVEFLKGQQEEERRAAFIAELKKKYPTQVSLRPPVIEVASAGRPERGGKNAPVTIIEFSDYECPFCKRAESTVEKVMTTYGDRVKLIYRDYPLPMHAHARPASEAAACANDQGKFWEYHAKLFHGDGLTPEKLKTYAQEVGLDQAKFDACLTGNPHKAAIDQDVEDGGKVGVNGTPAFFINGRMLSGAQPFEKFQEVIDEELAAKKTAGS